MQTGKNTVVVVGSINIDLVANTERIPVEGETVLGSDFQIHPGGKGANQAVAVARLGHPVSLIGRLGNDEFGAQLRAHLEKEGVDVSGVATTEGTSGVALIVVGKSGENCIVIIPGANAQLTPEDLDAHIEIIRSAGVVLTQLEIPTPTVQHLARICRRENVALILDPAPAKELPPDLFQDVEWFTPNETEAAFFIGRGETSSETGEPAAVAAKLLELGVNGVVLKLGARGAYVASQTGSTATVASFPVNAVDTTAAGDAFNGAFAVALLTRKDAAECARFASAAAAQSVTRPGAQPSLATMSEVQKLLEQQ